MRVRRIDTGDTIRIFNDRGACLASAVVDDTVLLGCIQLPTGAWFDPLDSAIHRPAWPAIPTR